MAELSETLKTFIILFSAGILFVSANISFSYIGKANQHRTTITGMTSISAERFRRATGPAVLIAGLWEWTFRALGYKLPLLIQLPVGLVLLGLFFWSALSRPVWGRRPDPISPWGKPESILRASWRAVRQNRYFALAFLTTGIWMWTVFTLQLKRITGDGMYLIGLALLATAFLIFFMRAAWCEPVIGTAWTFYA